MSGGGGASGETRYNWNDDMAPRWNNLLNYGMNQAFEVRADGSIHAKPRQSYTGERFTPLQYDQLAAGTNIRALNDYSSDPTRAMNAARYGIEDTLRGDYLSGAKSNPSANLDAANLNSYISGNEYMGESPAFNSMLQDTMGNMAEGYEQGTSAELTRLMNMSGAFGGSAHQRALANNQSALAKAMGQTANQMRSAQFDKSAGLRENELNRGFQNFNMGLDRGAQAYEGERNRMMGAIGAGQNEQGLALGRAGAQMGVGEMFQNQGQKQNDFLFDQWTQAQNHPFTVMNLLSGLYGQAMGGGAGMTQQIYGPSNTGGQIGGGLLGLAALLGGR